MGAKHDIAIKEKNMIFFPKVQAVYAFNILGGNQIYFLPLSNWGSNDITFQK